jgi:D-glycero-beta-D-manno-heptose-7-phosphate kinase
MTLPEIAQAFNTLNVLLIGDLMVDAYTWGKVDRISPEAPVPVVNVKKREFRLGGAGNVVKNLVALGAKPVVCSVIGNDSPGKQLLELLADEKTETNYIFSSNERSTTIKERVLAGSQQLVRIDTEQDHLLSETEHFALWEKIQLALETPIDVVLFQDYDKGVLSKTLIEQTTALAKSKGIPVVVDPKKRNFMHYLGATLFKPNFKELTEGLGMQADASKPSEVANIVHTLKEKLQLDGVLLTLSERGVYIDYNNQKHGLAAHLRSIADVSGAGDTVISIAALCVALKLPPKQIAELSNLGGGLVCEELGVVPINKKQLFSEAEIL